MLPRGDSHSMSTSSGACKVSDCSNLRGHASHLPKGGGRLEPCGVVQDFMDTGRNKLSSTRERSVRLSSENEEQGSMPLFTIAENLAPALA